MLTIGTIVLGVNDVARATDFWHAALGYVPREPGDETWVNPRAGVGIRGAAVPYAKRDANPKASAHPP